MHKTMKNDGKHALKEYLPNICSAMRTINQAPLKILEMINEYCQVFQGGVKDQFSQNNDHCAPEIWQEVIFIKIKRKKSFVLDRKRPRWNFTISHL